MRTYIIGLFVILIGSGAFVPMPAFAAYRFADFEAKPPLHVFSAKSQAPKGISPDLIKKIYNLPSSGGSGTIAIIGAYNDADIEKNLVVFDTEFGLPDCTQKNGCFEQHVIGTTKKASHGWALETALDVEWAHAIAPEAKILLVEAATPSGANLLSAIDYVRTRKDVVAASMSWGGKEFADETSLDSHFTNDHGITFFASSGDHGAGVSWPAVSPNVVAVGGTSLTLHGDNVTAEKAWAGSGGGVSKYEKQPAYQTAYAIPKASGMRAVPDVSYDADPASGFAIYSNGWYIVGGTSAGSPQWAAIKALGGNASNDRFYADKASTASSQYFKDIVSGGNGTCVYYCDARKRYDYVTGLGSPQTDIF